GCAIFHREFCTMERSSLTRYAWLSIAAALVTIGLKSLAYLLTGSVGLLSDAVESLVNLAAASMALAMLIIAARPADEGHPYGHSKAEYFASGIEGLLILIAVASIGVTAVRRILNPQPIVQTGVGLIVAAIASAINFIVARILLRVGKMHNSITLEADAHHLMTDVWTSAGVIAAVGIVSLTGWQILDPLVALGVASNIVWTGVHLIRRSVAGLMDAALSPEDCGKVQTILDKYKGQGVEFHALRTRQAAGMRFVSVHVLVPGKWTTHKGHHVVEDIEGEIRQVLPGANVITHLEPIEDPLSFHDGQGNP
ncbi:MAG TPA: cation diffusion facilitator family transporter, partial [Sedimentisphaerales bacterium]|nr:cation diffusion facilitator family transporter [Sedimentisphaerales bacterium]